MEGDGTAAEVAEHWIDPVALGLTLAPVDAIRGGDAHRNARTAREVLDGGRGAVRDVVVLNAAAALVAAQRCATLDEGLALADESLASGRAAGVLERVVALSATS